MCKACEVRQTERRLVPPERSRQGIIGSRPGSACFQRGQWEVVRGPQPPTCSCPGPAAVQHCSFYHILTSGPYQLRDRANHVHPVGSLEQVLREWGGAAQGCLCDLCPTAARVFLQQSLLRNPRTARGPKARKERPWPARSPQRPTPEYAENRGTCTFKTQRDPHAHSLA